MVLLYAWQKVIKLSTKDPHTNILQQLYPCISKVIQQPNVQIAPFKHGIESIITPLDAINMKNNEKY